MFVKSNFETYFTKFEDNILDLIKNNSNLNEMKQAIDLIYSVGTYSPLAEFKQKK